MTCLDENTVVAFFEGRLSQSASAELDEHIAACDGCRRLLAEYAAVAAPSRATVQGSGSEPTHERPSEAGGDEAALGRRISLAQAASRVGSVLCGKWRIDRVMGIGGMAQVFEATHRNGRKVALKILRPELVAEPALVERFLREGYVANRVEHPGAVAILDDDVGDDGAPFLVMELLHGRTLGQRLRDTGPLSAGEALAITVDLLDVLGAAHDKGIVHRDIKPDNLFQTDLGAIKVLDFGIARLRELMDTEGATQSGMTLGTVGYMSPEQARGRSAAVDAQSDIWALGATLFALLTGRVLHDAPTPNEALLLAMTQPVAPMATLAPELPERIGALLDRALAFEKSARFADCRAMRHAVQTLLGNFRGSSPAPRRSSSPAASAQNGTLLGVAASVPSIASEQPPPPPDPTEIVSPPTSVQSRSKRRLIAAAAVAVGVGVLGAIGAATRGSARSPLPVDSSAPPASAAATVAPVSAGSSAPVSRSDLAAPRSAEPVTARTSDAGPVPRRNKKAPRRKAANATSRRRIRKPRPARGTQHIVARSSVTPVVRPRASAAPRHLEDPLAPRQ